MSAKFEEFKKDQKLVNMKNKKHFASNAVAKLILTIGVLAAACSSLGSGVTRGTAATAIQADKRYSAAMAMTIDIGGRIANARGEAYQTSKDDTVEEAAVRAKADFMLRQPQIIVAEQLGFIKLYFEKGELGGPEMYTPSYRYNLGVWHFRPRAEITDKGKKLWQDLGLNVDEESLPLAVRGTPNVTGINDERTDMKKVDFSYKWEPTELGKAFAPDNAVFSKLTPELQDALKKVQQNMFGGGNNNIADFTTERKGTSQLECG